MFDGVTAPFGGLQLRDGVPAKVLHQVDLDAWHDTAASRIEHAARIAANSPVLTVGVATRPLPATLDPLLNALTLTVTGTDSDEQRTVYLPDPEAGLARLQETARRCPAACVAIGQLLRQTPKLDTLRGLAAEAAVFSMLLSGKEFASWLAERGDKQRPGDLDDPLVRMRREDDHLSITLDHPQRRNSLSFALREALYEALELAVIDDTITAVDVDGAGPVFCSGGDLAEFGTATDFVAAYLVRLERAPWRLIDALREKVTIHAHGAAIGAGIEMSAFAGRLAAAPGTLFQLPEVGMGLIPGAGGTVSIPRRIGRWRTAWMALSGQRIDTGTALCWGLIDALAEPC